MSSADDVIQVAKLLDDNGFRYVLIKSYRELPLSSDNVDVLIEEEDSMDVDQMLKTSGFKRVTRADEPFKILYRRVYDLRESQAPHIHTRIGWLGREFVNYAHVLDTRVTLDVEGACVYTADATHSLLITLAHAWFENKKFTSTEVHKVEVCLAAGVDWQHFWAETQSYNWKSEAQHALRISEVLNEKDLQTWRIPWRTVIFSWIAKVLGDPDNLSSKIGTFLYAVKIFFGVRLHRRSDIISLMGSDGSGKTTHARALLGELRTRGFLVTYIWTRGGVSIGRMYYRFVPNKQKGIVKKKGAVMRIVRVIDHVLLLYIRLFPLLLTRTYRVVICDRYAHDTLIDEGFAASGFFRAVCRLLPSPALTFYLHKGEPDMRYRLLLCSDGKHKGRFEEIDTGAASDSNQKRILMRVLERIYE